MRRAIIVIFILFLTITKLHAQHVGILFEVIENSSSPVRFSSAELQDLIYDSIESKIKKKVGLFKPAARLSRINKMAYDSMIYDYILEIQFKDSLWVDSAFLTFDNYKRIYRPQTDPANRMPKIYNRVGFDDDRSEEEIISFYISWVQAGMSGLIQQGIPISLTEPTKMNNKILDPDNTDIIPRTLIVDISYYTKSNVYTDKLWVLFSSVLASYQYFHDEIKTQGTEKLNIILFKDGRELKELNNHIEYHRIPATTLNLNISKNTNGHCLWLIDNAQQFVLHNNIFSVKSELCFTDEQLLNEPEVVHYQIYKNISSFFRLNP